MQKAVFQQALFSKDGMSDNCFEFSLCVYSKLLSCSDVIKSGDYYPDFFHLILCSI